MACLEEIAFRQGYIEAAQLQKLAERMSKSTYGEYLKRIVDEKVY